MGEVSISGGGSPLTVNVWAPSHYLEDYLGVPWGGSMRSWGGPIIGGSPFGIGGALFEGVSVFPPPPNAGEYYVGGHTGRGVVRGQRSRRGHGGGGLGPHPPHTKASAPPPVPPIPGERGHNIEGGPHGVCGGRGRGGTPPYPPPPRTRNIRSSSGASALFQARTSHPIAPPSPPPSHNAPRREALRPPMAASLWCDVTESLV